MRTTYVYDKEQEKLVEKRLMKRPEGPAIHVFQPQFFEHIAPEPVYVESKRQLREACKANGCFHPGYMYGFSGRG